MVWHFPMTTAKFSSMRHGRLVSTFSRLIPSIGANFSSSFAVSETDTLDVLIDAVIHLKKAVNELASVSFNLRTLSVMLPSILVSTLSPMEIAIKLQPFLYLLFQR